MALDRQNIHIPIAGGLDTKSDPKMLAPGMFTTLENVTTQTDGVFKKRNGYTALALTGLGSPSMSTQVKLATRVNELVNIDGSYLWSNDVANTAWQNRGSVSEVLTKKNSVMRDQTVSLIDPDVAYVGGLAFYVWTYGTGAASAIRCSVVDVSSGATLLYNFNCSSAGASRPRLVVCGSTVCILYVDPTNTIVKGRTITTAAPTTVTTEQSVAIGMNAGLPYFDVSPFNSTSFVLAYRTNTPNITIANFTTAYTVVPSTTVVVAENASSPVGLVATAGEQVWVAYKLNGGNNLRATAYNANTWAVSVAPFNVNTGVTYAPRNVALCRETASQIRIVWDNGSGPYNLHTQAVSSGGALAGVECITQNVFLHSRPFNNTGNGIGFTYVIVGVDSTVQGTEYLLEINNASGIRGRVVARIERGVSGVLRSDGTTCSVPLVSSGNYLAPLVTKFRISTSASAFAYTVATTAIDSINLDFTSTARFNSAELGMNLHVAGGSPQIYDGIGTAEHGFHLFPEKPATANGIAGTGSLAAGAYTYAVVYEWSDPTGQVHRSSPSLLAVASGVVNTGSVTLTGNHLTLTEKQVYYGVGGTAPPISIHIYRGTVNNAATLYRLTDPTSPGAMAVIQNNPTASTSWTYTDTLADSSITSNLVMYTNNQPGGVLPNFPPPPYRVSTVFKNRLWVVSDDDGVIWFSKEMTPGEGLAFNDALTYRLPTNETPTAVTSLDTYILIFTANSVFAVTGEPPNDSGLGSTLVTQRVASDAGCTEPRSIVAFDKGTMFKTAKGIYMIDRSLQTSYVGAPVEYYTTNYTNITSAVMVQDRREIRFTISGLLPPALTPAGLILVFNYDSNKWSTFNILSGTAGVSAVNRSAGYTWSSGSAIYQESATSFLDPGSTYIPMTIETGWIKPAGHSGYVRIRGIIVLGGWVSDHGLQVQFARDYADFYDESVLYPRTTLSAMTLDEVYHGLLTQKCEAFRMLISDYADGGTPGEGYSFAGFMLEAGVKRGSFEKGMSLGAKG